MRGLQRSIGILLFSALSFTVATVARAQILYTGVNLSTAEFGANTFPGTYNTNYTYPTSQELTITRTKE